MKNPAETPIRIDIPFLQAVADVESGGDPFKSTPTKRGLMQLSKQVWFWMNHLNGLDYGWDLAFDGQKNMEMGSLYLQWIAMDLLKKNVVPTEERVLSAWHAKPSKLEYNGYDVRLMTFRTRMFVGNVLKIKNRLSEIQKQRENAERGYLK